MKTEHLNYNLPEELIAQVPAEKRSASRLMVLKRADNSIRDCVFADITGYLEKGDCLVLNNTKVVPARFYGKRATGAKLEGLYLSQSENGWEVMLKNARKVNPGEDIILLDTGGEEFMKVQARPTEKGTWLLDIKGEPEVVLETIGFAPLPPYIKRKADDSRREFDRQRYQTVYAKSAGAVAAPTAGLHFTDELLEDIKHKGIETAYVTLHVGAGTFKPVTSENLEDHLIHSERYSVDKKNAEIINRTKQNGGKVFAVGTTSVRTLESVAEVGKVKATSGDTKLFITPGYEFKITDGIITNFHLPKSTLLALVGGFAGMDFIMKAYSHAVEERYRFYSYGDAMLIL